MNERCFYLKMKKVWAGWAEQRPLRTHEVWLQSLGGENPMQPEATPLLRNLSLSQRVFEP